MKKGFILTPFLIALVLVTSGYLAYKKYQEPKLALGAIDPVSYTKSLFPTFDSTSELGTSTRAYLRLTTDEICLAGDCQTSWSAGGGEANTGASLGTGLNIFDSKLGSTLRFNSISAGSNISISTTSDSNTLVISSTGGSGSSAYEIATTSGIAVPQVAYFTQTGGRTTLGSVATGTITCSGTGISCSTTGLSVLGGNLTITGSDTNASSTLLSDLNTWSARQDFNGNASTTGLTVTGSTYLATTGGNVGIGTTSPPSLLTVAGGGSAAQLRLDSTAAVAEGVLMYRSGVEKAQFGLAASTNNGVTGTVFNDFFIRSTGNMLFSAAPLAAHMVINTSGNIGIGTTTPTYLLNPYSATAPQLSLSAGAGLAQWGFRNAGGNFYLSTTTVAGTATSSISALEIAGGGFGTTTLRGLNINGQATTTSNVGFRLTAGCYAGIDGICITGGSGLSSYDAWTHPSAGISATSSEIRTNGIVSQSSSTVVGLFRTVGIGLGKTPSASIRHEILTDSTYTQGVRIEGDSLSRLGFSAFITGDSFVRYTQGLGGLMEWGDGTTVADTNLYRNSANTLRTDDSFITTLYGLIGTTTQTNISQLTVASSTASQFSLSAGIGIPQWTMRNAGGNLYFATTTVAGTATTSTAALEIKSSGVPSLIVGTSTPSSVSNGMMVLGTGSPNASTTIQMGKIQFDGYSSSGTRQCVFWTGSAWGSVNGACTQ